MKNHKLFVEGMIKLAWTFGRRPQGKEWETTLKVYREALDDLADELWLVAVNSAIRMEEFFPPPGTLRRYAGAGKVALSAEADIVFDRLLKECGVYLSNAGKFYTDRAVEEKLGPAAAIAFRAAGGSDKFTNMPEKDLRYVKSAFQRAYVAAASTAPAQLQAGVDQPRSITREEAPGLLATITDTKQRPDTRGLDGEVARAFDKDSKSLTKKEQ